MQFRFGQKVRKIGGKDIFVVLGEEPSGMIQLAAFNWKTAARPKELVAA